VIALGEARLGLLARSVNVAHHLSCVGPEIIQVGEGDIRLILQDGTYGFDQSLLRDIVCHIHALQLPLRGWPLTLHRSARRSHVQYTKS
jgi:hypothetical protein